MCRRRIQLAPPAPEPASISGLHSHRNSGRVADGLQLSTGRAESLGIDQKFIYDISDLAIFAKILSENGKARKNLMKIFRIYQTIKLGELRTEVGAPEPVEHVFGSEALELLAPGAGAWCNRLLALPLD